mgnify:FL=1
MGLIKHAQSAIPNLELMTFSMNNQMTEEPQNLVAIQHRWCQAFTNEQGRISAWTFVPKTIVGDVLSGKLQTCSMEFSEQDPLFQLAYAWMKDAMDEAGIKGREPGMNPWWCWIRMGADQIKPTDLQADEASVLLELSLDPKDVLLSDFDMWHVPLNYWLNAEGAEEESFENELKLAGLNIFEDKPLPEPFHTRVQASWRDVFCLDRVNGYTGELKDKSIQGVFWKMSPESINGIVEPDLYTDSEAQFA